MNEMPCSRHQVGMLVEHLTLGLGKVLSVTGSKVIVYFRDHRGKHLSDACKKFPVDSDLLKVAKLQNDPWLDNLSVFDPEKPLKRIRYTLQQAIERFQELFPLGFNDPKYLSAKETQEREYKWKAHLLYKEVLGDGQLRHLLNEDDVEQLVQYVQSVEGKTNLLSPYEKMAFHDALKNREAARQFLSTLADLLEQDPIEKVCAPYFMAVSNLPAEEGKARVSSWPVATILPYLAQPNRFMFLKPEATSQCAEILNFNLCYNPKPNWLTYQKLLQMCDLLMVPLKKLGARDMIDLQSFIWRTHRE